MTNITNLNEYRKRKTLKEIERVFSDHFGWRYLRTAELENQRFRDEMKVYGWPGFNGPDVA